MPLHGQHPPSRIERFGALDDAVARPRGDAQVTRDAIERLMMRGIGRETVRAQCAGEIGVFFEADFVHPLIAASARIVVRRIGTLARNVLNEGAAERHIHDLNAAADRERWQAPASCFDDQGDLAFVAGLVRL